MWLCWRVCGPIGRFVNASAAHHRYVPRSSIPTWIAFGRFWINIPGCAPPAFTKWFKIAVTKGVSSPTILNANTELPSPAFLARVLWDNRGGIDTVAF